MDTKLAETIHSGDSSKKCQGQLIICTPAKDCGLCLQEKETVLIQPDQMGGQIIPGGECWEEGGKEVSLLRGKEVGTEVMSSVPLWYVCVGRWVELW